MDIDIMAERDGVVLRGVHVPPHPMTENQPATAWFSSLDGAHWVLNGMTTHNDVERVLDMSANPRIITDALERTNGGFAWDEITDLDTAIRLMNQPHVLRCELQREVHLTEDGAAEHLVTRSVRLTEVER